MPRVKRFTKKKCNILDWLTYSQLGSHQSNYRSALHALGALVRDKDTKFEKLKWTRESPNTVSFQDNKLYMDKFRRTLILDGKNGLPSQLFHLKDHFEDVVVFTSPVHKTVHHDPQAHKPFLLALARSNWLHHYDNFTGQLYAKVYLGDPNARYKFRQLNWETEGETVVLQSTYRTFAKAATNDMIQAVAVFAIYPLKFIAMFEITTAIFGKGVRAANCAGGLFILGTGSGANKSVQIFSLDHILKQVTDKCCCKAGETHHDDLSGLCLNVILKEQPPMLFQVNCSENTIHYGGFPFHHMFTPPKSGAKYLVVDSSTGKVKSQFDLKSKTAFPDTCDFHPDESGRIVYVSANNVKFYKFTTNCNSEQVLEEQFELSIPDVARKLPKSHGIKRPKRAAKQVINYFVKVRTVLSTNFENELEIFSVLGIDGTDKGRIALFDNDDGQLIGHFKVNEFLKELGNHKSNYRSALHALGALVRDKDTKFEKLPWTKESPNTVLFQDNKLYLDNYRRTLILDGKNGLPSQLFQLKDKFEDVVVFTSPVHRTVQHDSQAYKPFLIALTKSNWLHRYDNYTGQLYDKVYLGDSKTRYKFRQLNWETEGETVLLQSTYRTFADAETKDLIQAVAIFAIYPLKFVAMFEIRTAIFGKGVKSANCAEGLLILGAGAGANKSVQMFSLDHILKQAAGKCFCEVGEAVHDESRGLCLNIRLEERPPMLFRVNCSEDIVHYGGYPFHYMFTPPKSSGKFLIVDLSTGNVKSEFDFKNETAFPDSCEFHSDESGRIVYVSPHNVKFFKFNSEQALEEQFALSIPNVAREPPTSFGIQRPSRAARQGRNYYVNEKTVLCTDFENELEIFSVLGIDATNKGRIAMFDNDDGQMIRHFQVNEYLQEFLDYNLVLDLDTFVLIEKLDPTNIISLYRMKRGQ
ncbi:DDB1- and CUL4-associated factor 17 [Halotydeus destructor]|nr:DDB1- and CUL4-associated factor 17 [Halotydeus destructor]